MSYDDSDDIRSLILSPRRNSDEEGDEWEDDDSDEDADLFEDDDLLDEDEDDDEDEDEELDDADEDDDDEDDDEEEEEDEEEDDDLDEDDEDEDDDELFDDVDDDARGDGIDGRRVAAARTRVAGGIGVAARSNGNAARTGEAVGCREGGGKDRPVERRVQKAHRSRCGRHH